MASKVLHMHAHRCPECGHVWRHTDDNAGDAAAHTCAACGAGPEWHKAGGAPSSPAVPWIALGLVLVGAALILGDT